MPLTHIVTFRPSLLSSISSGLNCHISSPLLVRTALPVLPAVRLAHSSFPYCLSAQSEASVRLAEHRPKDSTAVVGEDKRGAEPHMVSHMDESVVLLSEDAEDRLPCTLERDCRWNGKAGEA